MKTSFQIPALLRKRGVALILVVSILALLTILMLAMFTSTDNEFKSTQGYVASQDARRLGDLCTNIVVAQLQKAAQPSPGSTARTIHATQPGCARVYNLDGSFHAAYKLYSSDTMQITGSTAVDELNVLNDANSLATWDKQVDRYVDLNDPVIRAGTGTGGVADVYFPIVDPTAYQTAWVGTPPRSNSQSNVEGFAYGISGDVAVDGEVLPTGNSTGLTAQRLPMPVEWMYVLQNGTMGTLNAGGNFVASTGATSPTNANPIVGRVAFWTDDESCKININTASEETFWATPRFFHERDHEWAEKPPQAKEYQRFPGHPATVCMSSVLFPDVPGTDSFDFFGQAVPTNSPAFQQMQRIFDIAPKIARGGSFSGTQVYASDDQVGYTVADTSKGGVDVTNSIKERLYASVDELLYSQNMDNGSPPLRQLNDQWVPPLPTGAVTTPNATVISSANNSVNTSITPSLQATIQRSRFFLTANSRAPEFSMLGVPKVCMWPISQTNDAKHRTVYDSLIAFCATLRNGSATNANNIYYFQRGAVNANTKPAHSATYDIGLTRNSQLMGYLKVLLRSTMPLTSPYTGSSAGNAQTIGDKYGSDNLHTILAEIFDYIRTTNLYDDILSSNNVQAGTVTPQVPTNLSNTQIYDSNPPLYYTYTNPLIWNLRSTDPAGNALSNPKLVGNNGWPGHGTVSPCMWVDEGGTYRGMGRFFTISEIGLHLICTADGQNDSGSYTANGVTSGGRTGEKVSHKDQNKWVDASESATKKTYWYSNYAPYPAIKTLANLKLNFNKASTDPSNPNSHPAFDPMNWNCTLPDDTAMAANQKRVQGLLDLELFCPSEGYTIMHPEWTLVLDGKYLSSITINGVPMWSTTAQVVVKSNQNIWATNTSVSRTGGSADPADLYSGRGINAIGRIPADQNYDTSASSDPNAQLANCGLATGFFTVTSGQNIQLKFPSAGSGMKIQIFDTHNWQAAKEVQDINVDFAKSSGSNTINVPAPCLVTVSTEWRHFLNGATMYDQGAVDCCHFWCFNYDGCIARYEKTGQSITATNLGSYTWVQKAGLPSHSSDIQSTAGRFALIQNATTIANGNVSGFSSYTNATANNPVASAGLIYSPPSAWIAANPSYAHDYGEDVVRTVIPALGDYRIMASMYNVPSNIWQIHRLWNATNSDGTPVYQAHNFTAHDSSSDAGFDFNLNVATNLPNKPQFMRALGTTVNMNSKMPDIPQDDGTQAGGAALSALNSYGDFDNAPGNTRDGAYNNKPDEGDFAALAYVFGAGQKTYRGAYYYDAFEMQTDPSNSTTNNLTAYFTPNRLISSPVMFGSLVTNVFNPVSGFEVTSYPTTGCGRPWQTLLFRPHVTPTSDNSISSTTTGGLRTHPGAMNPPDHYLLDLFNMPIVEPYAISEPLSEAGKINLNYQIVPFTYIHRATAVYAAMKGEQMRCIRTADNNSGTSGTVGVLKYKGAPSLPSGQTFPPVVFWNETAASVTANNRIYWTRHIDPVETLKQLDERFSMSASFALPDKRMGLLRCASQICELYMIPSNPTPLPLGMFQVSSSTTPALRDSNMQKFWGAHCLTGDNTREEIYSHLYPKFTTRSNTFRVHVRTQTLKKTRSGNPATFDSTKGDSVVSEFRGSYLMERYIDPNDTSNVLPDYAGTSAPLNLPSLDSFYRFHIIEAKRFDP